MISVARVNKVEVRDVEAADLDLPEPLEGEQADECPGRALGRAVVWESVRPRNHAVSRAMSSSLSPSWRCFLLCLKTLTFRVMSVGSRPR